MNERTRRRAGMTVAAVLAADALVHVYWMTGATWPARDPAALSLAVLNFEVPFTPRGLLMPFTLLVTGSAVMLAHVGGRLPGRIGRAAVGAVAAGLLARGSVGVVWALGIGANTDSPFYRLNLLAYTPVCWALFAAAVITSEQRIPARFRPVANRRGMS
ncbi:DUF3995 domain-containing protein [Streptomyces sp. NPDC060028]|uniref:DUF3995 domain-containing protein n=1 Tax=Streptomyces sp. NPDC060028 TaxID=3347041 RepID=UPI0036786940